MLADFSKNQWRKGPGHAKCTGCVQCQGKGEAGGQSNKISWESMIGSITCDAKGCGNSSPVSHGVIYCSEGCYGYLYNKIIFLVTFANDFANAF